MTDWQPGQPVTLETENFILRSMTVGDITDEYVAWWNDPEVRKGFNRKPQLWTREHAVQHIKPFDNKNTFHLALYTKDEGKLIGFFAIFADFKHGTGSTNFCLGDKEWWGKDVFVEVKPRVLDFMFETLGLAKAESESKGRNFKAFYTNRALGIKSEGILREQAIDEQGRRIDVFLFGITKAEWQQRKAKR